MAHDATRPVFLSVLMPIRDFGLIAPYAMSTPFGVIWIEVCYQFGTGEFREIRMDIPPSVKEVEPHEIKD